MSITGQVAPIAISAATTDALGGGKFANGADTGAWVMMFNRMAQQNLAKKYIKEYFSHVEGLNELHTDKTPDDYELTERGNFLKDGIISGAVTVYIGDGMSDVYLSPASQRDPFTLYLHLDHEMIHVAPYNRFEERLNPSHSEYSAYRWMAEVSRNLWPDPDNKIYLKEMRRISRKYEQNSNYNYDKFGFSSMPPRSLWNW